MRASIPPAAAPPTDPLTLRFLPLQPRLQPQSRIHGCYENGVLNIASDRPVIVSLAYAGWSAPAVQLRVDAARLGAPGEGALTGWLTMYDVPVMPLRWLPSRWLDSLGDAPGVIATIWHAIAPPPQGALTAPSPPQSLMLKSHVGGDAWQMDITGVWHHAMTVTQSVALQGDGSYHPGSGSLQYDGPLQPLSTCAERDLLPLAGMTETHPRTLAVPPCPPGPPVAVRASWGANPAEADRFVLQATLRTSLWHLEGQLTSGGASDTRDVAVRFAGRPAALAAAFHGLVLPRSCGVDNVDHLVAQVVDKAQNWSSRQATWESTQVQGAAEARSTAGLWQGRGQLDFLHGGWLDRFYARLHPAPPPSCPPHVFDAEEAGPWGLEESDPAPLGPLLRLAAGAASFATGGPLRVDTTTLRDLGGTWPTAGGATLHLQRHRLPDPRPPCVTAMPRSGIQSLTGLWRNRGTPSLYGGRHAAKDDSAKKGP